MHEKSLILIDGPPGSGSTRLSRSMKERLLEEKISIEHISTGDRLRAIGKGVIDSAYTQEVIDHFNNSGPNVAIEDTLMYAVVDEALTEYRKHQILISNGFPRYGAQVDDLMTLSDIHERTIRGAIITHADWQTSLDRMIARGLKDDSRAVDRNTAIDRLADRMTSLPAVLEALEQNDIQIRYVDTDGPKTVTDRLGFLAFRSLYASGNLDQTKNAS